MKKKVVLKSVDGENDKKKMKKKKNVDHTLSDGSSSDVEMDESDVAVKELRILGGSETAYCTIGPNIEFSSPVPNSPMYFGCGKR